MRALSARYALADSQRKQTLQATKVELCSQSRQYVALTVGLFLFGLLYAVHRVWYTVECGTHFDPGPQYWHLTHNIFSDSVVRGE